jgi:Flp pilus assembly protein TadG
MGWVQSAAAGASGSWLEVGAVTPMLRSLRQDQAGAAIIELAFVAPILALVVLGIVDISNAYSRKLALEQGAQRAIEKIMQTTANDTIENTLKDEACKQVDGLAADGTSCLNTPITSGDVTVTWTRACMNKTTYAYTSTTAGGATSPKSYTTSDDFNADSCASTDKEADYLQVRIASSYTPMFPVHFAGYDGTKYPLSATAGVRVK